MSAPVGDNSIDAKLKMWTLFRTLPADKKDILVSHELSEKIREFETRFKLQRVLVSEVSVAIRELFFGAIDAKQAEAKLHTSIISNGGNDQNTAPLIVEAIQKEVMTIVPAPEPIIEEEVYVPIEQKPTTVKLPLLKAMSEYKRVADQLITSEKLKLRNSLELVRPTLSNWIRSYREELGIGFHEPVQRGNFLFQTTNGKKLNNEDRAKLNLILKSIEEQFPLEIDPKREVIVFPAGTDASMELTQVNAKARPGANQFIQPRSMPRGVRPGPLPQGATLRAQPNVPSSSLTPSNILAAKPTPTNPALANLKPLFSKAAPPEKNISGETLHFSTGHVLPAEKATEKSGQPTLPQAGMKGIPPAEQVNRPAQVLKREPGAALPKSPYSIRPLRLRNDDQSSA